MKCVRCHAEIDKSYMACPHCGEAITDFLRRYLDHPIDGKYEILERLGAGGMGEVFKVRHTYLGALRVIKLIRPQIAGSKDAIDRFLREAQLATKVHHQNVATLHDFSALPDDAHCNRDDLEARPGDLPLRAPARGVPRRRQPRRSVCARAERRVRAVASPAGAHSSVPAALVGRGALLCAPASPRTAPRDFRHSRH